MEKNGENAVSFQIPDDRTTLQFIWANEIEECACPPYSRIRHCGCNINTFSLPRASYSEDAIHFTNLTIQANNTKVYFVNSMTSPINQREIYRAYHIIIILGKSIVIYSSIYPVCVCVRVCVCLFWGEKLLSLISISSYCIHVSTSRTP